MRVQRLKLENFRGFRALDLDLSVGNTTVIVGINGAGKTSILDALSIALSDFAAKLCLHDSIGFRRLELSDLKVGERRAALDVELEIAPPEREKQTVSFSHSLDSRGVGVSVWRTHSGDVVDPSWFTRLYRDPSTSIPAIAVFPTERSLDPKLDESRAGNLPSRATELYSATFWRRTNLQEFLRWFLRREDYENEQIRESRAYIDPQLQAVRRALAALMPGYQNLRVRRARPPGVEDLAAWPDEGPIFVLQKGDTLLRLSQLSHGEQGLLAMVGDIARRLAITHSALEDPLQGEGVVLIDEIELHLHPQWQREIVPNLEKIFPNLQFIVTTHSPQVLSLVPGAQVKVLDNFELVSMAPHTFGRDSNSILWEVMGVPRHPRFSAAHLEQIGRLIDGERWAEADQELDKLEHAWGPDDADVRRLRSMLAFLRAEAG